MSKNKQNILRFLALSGVLAAVFYFAHVITGRMIWPDYNPFAQPISDLTADTAVSKTAASSFLHFYSFFNLLFCVVLILFFIKIVKINKIFYSGLILKTVAEVLSTFGYLLFPLADTEWNCNFQNIIHYALTGVIVACYIVLSILLAAGLGKTKKYPAMTKFLFSFSAVFIVSGFLTAIAVNVLPEYAGLVERVNLYSLMTANIVLSLWMFRISK